MGFQKNVLIIALVILSITIIVLASFISGKEKEKEWPPEVSTCPPYFDISQNGNNIQCSTFSDGVEPGVSLLGTDITFKDAANGTNNNCKKFIVQTEAGAKMSAEDKCDYSEKCKINWEGYCEKPGFYYT